jgi:hypothetical protein
MKSYRVKFWAKSTQHNVVVSARYHEEAYREALILTHTREEQVVGMVFIIPLEAQ